MESIRSYLSTCAARQFADVLVERQRGQLQALDCREVGEDRVAQLLHCHSALDGHRRRLDAVRPFRRQNVRAEESPRAAIRHQLDEPTRVPGRAREERDEG